MEGNPPHHTHTITTHDFMNVDSFSQLPFIRSPPTTPEKERAIRVFGIELGASEYIHSETRDDNNHQEKDAGGHPINNMSANSIGNSNSKNNRRFECHYCCRNFPTSQALGGHQNAHKRERQHAKRLHHQSAAAAAAFAHRQFYGSRSMLSDPNIHGSASLIRYGHFGSAVPSHSSSVYGGHRYGFEVYNSHQTPTTPITGSPLGLWRVQSSSSFRNGYTSATATFNRDLSSNNQHLGLLSGDHELNSSHVGGASSALSMFFKSKTGAQDHVSLDLHL